MYMNFEVLFQNEKFKIIEFLGNVYIDIPKEGIPYVAFGDEKFYPIRGFFSSECQVSVNPENDVLVLFFESEVSLYEIITFTKLVNAKSNFLRPIRNDEDDIYLRILMNL